MSQTPDPRRRMRISGALMIVAGLLMIVGSGGELIWGEAKQGAVREAILIACGFAVVWCGVVFRRLPPVVVPDKPPDEPGAGTPVGSKR